MAADRSVPGHGQPCFEEFVECRWQLAARATPADKQPVALLQPVNRLLTERQGTRSGFRGGPMFRGSVESCSA